MGFPCGMSCNVVAISFNVVSLWYELQCSCNIFQWGFLVARVTMYGMCTASERLINSNCLLLQSLCGTFDLYVVKYISRMIKTVKNGVCLL